MKILFLQTIKSQLATHRPDWKHVFVVLPNLLQQQQEVILVDAAIIQKKVLNNWCFTIQQLMDKIKILKFKVIRFQVVTIQLMDRLTSFIHPTLLELVLVPSSSLFKSNLLICQQVFIVDSNLWESLLIKKLENHRLPLMLIVIQLLWRLIKYVTKMSTKNAKKYSRALKKVCLKTRVSTPTYLLERTTWDNCTSKHQDCHPRKLPSKEKKVQQMAVWGLKDLNPAIKTKQITLLKN